MESKEPLNGLVVLRWAISGRILLGTYKIWVHLFETGSADEFAKGAVTISAAEDVDALRDAIRDKFKLEVAAYKLVVKPTRNGAPQDPETNLWAVPFEGSDKGIICQAYVEVPKQEAGGKRKRDELILSLLQNISARIGTAGPTPSMTEVGRTGLIGAIQEDFIEIPSEFAALTDTEQKTCASNRTEKALTAEMTPFLERIFENRCVVNSEDFAWVGLPFLAAKLKSDLLWVRTGVYESKVPKTSSEEIVQNLRKAQPHARFGPCYWYLRDSVFLGACKLKVENAGIGEFLNNQMHLNQNERMCGFLFDAEECWLIESFGLKCSRYKRVPWTAKGSLKEIRNFFQWNRGWHAITEMCRVLEVEIVEGEPYLGMGAHGRVFRVRRTGGHHDEHHALKVVQAKDKWSAQKELARLNHEAKRCPLLVQPTSELRGTDGLFGYTMQPIGQSVRSLWKPSFIPHALSSLRDLHRYGIVHGDPRLENLLFCSLTTPHYVWADLVGLTTLDSTSPPASRLLNYQEDMSPRAICSSLRPL